MKLALFAAPAFALAGLSVDSVQPLHGATLTPEQVMQVQQITIETLKNNPNLIKEQIDTYQLDKIQKEQFADTKLIKQYKKQILSQNDNLTFGNSNASVVLVEFIDYNCSHCKNLVHTIKEATYNDPQVRVIVKEMPVLGKSSVNAAKAAIAAANQGKYLKFQNYLLTTKNAFNEKSLFMAAKQIGLNLKKFKADFNSKTTRRYIQKNLELAKLLKIKATPTMIITDNTTSFGKIIPGDLSFNQLNTLVLNAKSKTIS